MVFEGFFYVKMDENNNSDDHNGELVDVRISRRQVKRTNCWMFPCQLAREAGIAQDASHRSDF